MIEGITKKAAIEKREKDWRNNIISVLCHSGGSFYSYDQVYKQFGSFHHSIPSADIYSK